MRVSGFREASCRGMMHSRAERYWAASPNKAAPCDCNKRPHNQPLTPRAKNPLSYIARRCHPPRAGHAPALFDSRVRKNAP